MQAVDARLLVAGLLAGAAFEAAAQTPSLAVSETSRSLGQSTPVALRAVAPVVPDRTIDFIAANAAPFELGKSARVQLAQLTFAQGIARICGSYQERYFNALLKANGLDNVSATDRIGEKAETLAWPACLYVERDDSGIRRKVRPSETASEIYGTMTGKAATVAALSKFFNKPASNLKSVRPDEVLTGSYRTAPVGFFPLNMSKADFVQGVLDSSAKPGSEPTGAAPKVREASDTPGHIVLGGTVATTDMACRKASGEPFDVHAVEESYRFAAKRRLAAQPTPPKARADVLVVDNGFFGASAQAHPGKAFEGSPFKERFFSLNDTTTVARSLRFEGGESRPINFENDVTPGPVSGHGTHVTGLLLGGPGFEKFRDDWPAMDDPWSMVTILNVARGRENLISGSANLLQGAMTADSKGRIVNLSLTHDGRSDKDVGAAYKRLFAVFSNTLFVVAAGNSHEEVARIKAVPAMYGGNGATNVVTVAALDGDGGLAPFTNRGKYNVDMAAPGCGLDSWFSNTRELLSLSGTSQAAPLVTFAASLLRSLDGDASAEALKQRLVLSGDLLGQSKDQDQTAFRVQLNIPKALMWFDDYVELKGENAGRYLGQVVAVSGVQCAGTLAGGTDALTNLWAIKRSDAGEYLYGGRSASRLDAPCSMSGAKDGQVVFLARWQLLPGDDYKAFTPVKHVVSGMSDVTELIVGPGYATK